MAFETMLLWIQSLLNFKKKSNQKKNIDYNIINEKFLFLSQPPRCTPTLLPSIKAIGTEEARGIIQNRAGEIKPNQSPTVDLKQAGPVFFCKN